MRWAWHLSRGLAPAASGSINLATNTPSGVYKGTFTVSVSYNGGHGQFIRPNPQLEFKWKLSVL
jgi:hypothetical protein